MEEDDEILDYILEQIKDFSLISKNSKDIKKDIKECWDTDVNNYTEESLYRLWWMSESHIIKWCKKKMDSLKK